MAILIFSSVDGKIGRTAVTVGNDVSPSSGALATIVSQDPMHVVFGVSSRSAIALRDRSTEQPIVVKIRLADGHIYGQTGTLNFFDNTVAGNTDTITVRGDVRNPLGEARAAQRANSSMANSSPSSSRGGRSRR